MAADVLAIQGTNILAAMLFSFFSQNIPISVPESSILLKPH